MFWYQKFVMPSVKLRVNHEWQREQRYSVLHNEESKSLGCKQMFLQVYLWLPASSTCALTEVEMPIPEAEYKFWGKTIYSPLLWTQGCLLTSQVLLLMPTLPMTKSWSSPTVAPDNQVWVNQLKVQQDSEQMKLQPLTGTSKVIFTVQIPILLGGLELLLLSM